MAIPVCREPNMELRPYAVDSGTVIEKNWPVWLDTNDVKPASDFTWDTDLATTQAGFSVVFVGIAYESSADGETNDILIDISGNSVYEYDCASATFQPGTPVAPAKDTGNALLNNKLVSCAAAAAIGRTVAPVQTSVTRVRAKFASAHQPLNVNANVG